MQPHQLYVYRRADTPVDSADQLKQQFNTNVFGLLDVTTAVLPHMRSRHAGTIVMIGSRSAWRTDISVNTITAE